MLSLIRVVLIGLLTAGITWLVVNANWEHGLLVIAITVLPVIATLTFLDNPRNWWSALLAVLLIGGLIMLGMSHGSSWLDIGLISMTVILNLILVSVYLDPDDQWWGFVVLLVTPLLVLLGLQLHGIPVKPPGGGVTQAETQFHRILQALGTDSQEQAKHELGAICGLPNSDTWNYGPCGKIPTSGPWPVSVLFPGFADAGNAITVGLWGQRIEVLQIAERKAALQPLLNCRNTVRHLFGKSQQFTPFFQVEDFGGAKDTFRALEDQIYKWAHGHLEAVKTLNKECEAKSEGSKNIMAWIKTCLEPIGGGFADDKDLQQLKALGVACGAVRFISR